MKTDIALDKLCNLTPIIEELRPKLKQDAELKAIMVNYTAEGKKDDNVGFILRILPHLLNEYREAAYKIIAIVTDKDVEEIKEQPITVTFKEIKSLLEDEDMRSFFSLV